MRAVQVMNPKSDVPKVRKYSKSCEKAGRKWRPSNDQLLDWRERQRGHHGVAQHENSNDANYPMDPHDASLPFPAYEKIRGPGAAETCDLRSSNAVVYLKPGRGV